MKLEIKGVSKQYRNGQLALKDFNLELNNGILGLLGPNGAGKSTLMHILATLTKPTSGTVLLNGESISKEPNGIRKVLGYLPQDFGVYPNLTAYEFLEYMAALKGLNPAHSRRRIQDLLEALNLEAAAKKPIGSYSGGMRQRVGIAQALLNNPKILIVDEPTVGLDPEERIRFRNLLSDLSGDRIVILSTHVVSDVESIASNLAIMNKGRLIVRDRPESLLKKMEGSVWECLVTNDDLPALREKWLIANTVRRVDGPYIRVISKIKPMMAAVNVIPTLEDVYLNSLSDSRTEKVEVQTV